MKAPSIPVVTSRQPSTGDATMPSDAGKPSPRPIPAILPAIRFLVSIAGGIVICAVLWHFVPKSLTGRTDIVGYPTFADFDSNRYMDAFYLVVIAFPLSVALLYHLTARLPGLSHRRTRRGIFPLQVRPAHENADEPVTTPGAIISTLLRVGLPALVIALEVSIARSAHSSTLTRSGVTAGIAYVVIVLAAGLAIARRDPHSSGQWIENSTLPISTINSVACLLVIPVLYFVSRSTTITVGSDVVRRFPWLPLWLVIPVWLGTSWWVVMSLRRGQHRGSPRRIELYTLMLVVGSVGVFLGTAVFPSALGPFAGFDDSQYLSASQLIFGHGLHPWSQVVPFHGFLYDVFGGATGMALFGNSRWGAAAGQDLILVPLTCVSYFLLGAYFLRRRPILVAAMACSIVFGVFGSFDYRWLLFPLLFVALDRTLRNKRPMWAIVFASGSWLQALLVPETSLIVLVLLLVVVLFELCTKQHGESLLEALPRSRWIVISGGVLSAAFLAYLAVTGAVGSFINFYLIVGHGHLLEGAKPIGRAGSLLVFPGNTRSFRYTVEFLLPILLVLATAWQVVARIRMRRPWSTVHWVTLAAAGGIVAYFEEAIGRADGGHIQEMFLAFIPLLVLSVRNVSDRLSDVTISAARWSRARISRWAEGWHATPSLRGRHIGDISAMLAMSVATSAVLLVTIFLAPVPVRAVRNFPADFHASTPTAAPANLPRLGYTVPGSVDTAQIQDLATVIDSYTRPRDPVFDFANETGVTNYLLNRVPGTRFDVVNAAQTARAQRLVVADLKASKPKLVIYYANDFGLPVMDAYNGIPIYNMVQYYIVSQYLLDHYRPIMDVDGQLILLRNNLQQHLVPRLSTTPVTSNLNFVLGPCAWGYTPEFLNDQPSRTAELRVPFTTTPTSAGTEVDLRLPASADLSRYSWISVTTDRPGNQQFALAESVGSALQQITWWTLPQGGRTTSVEVGSCLQWHGFSSSDLHLMVSGGGSVRSITLMN